MTCAECMDALLVVDLRRRLENARGESESGGEADIAQHTAGCEQCARAMAVVRSGEESLAERLSLDGARLQAAGLLAQHAQHRVRRERLVRWIVMPTVVLGFIVGLTLLVTSSAGLRRYFLPPPTVETRTFTLTCLSGEQAASLLQPYLPRPENPLWQAEAFDVRAAGGGIRAVTVRAPRVTLASVPGLLATFERDPRAACRTGGTETH
jgi:hypothetical protein